MKYKPAQKTNQTLLKTVDCKYGDWVWDDCSITCGEGGFQIGTRPILIEASGGGDPCDEETVDGRSCGDPCMSGNAGHLFPQVIIHNITLLSEMIF